MSRDRFRRGIEGDEGSVGGLDDVTDDMHAVGEDVVARPFDTPGGCRGHLGARGQAGGLHDPGDTGEKPTEACAVCVTTSRSTPIIEVAAVRIS